MADQVGAASCNASGISTSITVFEQFSRSTPPSGI
jgi:hypothetical protein